MLDFEKLEESLSKNEECLLTLNRFDHGKVYYQKNGHVVNGPSGQFQKNTLGNIASSHIDHCEIPIPQKAHFNERHLKILPAIAPVRAIQEVIEKQENILRIRDEMPGLKVRSLNPQLIPHFCSIR